jgi:hypothetical protein
LDGHRLGLGHVLCRVESNLNLQCKFLAAFKLTV